jgi:hypothetical protein
MATSAVPKPAENEKKKRQRSPNYPTVGLREAVDRTKRFVTTNGKGAAMPAIAAKLIGFATAHGQAYSALSALKKFGLLEETGGRVAPTQRAMEIVSLPEADPRRLKAIRESAISPTIYAELLKEYSDTNIPNDETLAGELVAYKGFNPNGVKEFLKAFRETIEFAGLSDLTVLGYENKANETPNRVKVGDYVQWESRGQLQFREPKKVREITEDDKGNKFALVEGSLVGAPIGEVTVEDAPPNPLKPRVQLPVRESSTSGGSASMRQDVFSLAEGDVILTWPTPLSAKSIEWVKNWLKIAELKIVDSEKPAQETEPTE